MGNKMCLLETIELRISLVRVQLEEGDWRDSSELTLDEIESMSDDELLDEIRRLEIIREEFASGINN